LFLSTIYYQINDFLPNFQRKLSKMVQINSPLTEMPTIVVFGDQCSGKSSVLWRLIGCLPLPR
jgi:hypothetical protein